MNGFGMYQQQFKNSTIISDLSKTQKINIEGEELEIQPIGSGCEVGRSCIIIKFQGKKIMLDCGVHPAFNGITSLPFFDEIEPGDIDLLLVTHFHLDHCGALPYFLEKTNFRGECYMTNPTIAIYNFILADYVKVSHSKSEESLYNEKDLKNSTEKIKLLNYHQEIEYKGIKFSAFNAGHVLGAAMFLIEIAGVKILYTGDYSREADRHLEPAEIPNKEINVLIVESTYGIHQHENRDEREKNFIKYVDEVVSRGGKCLLPVFAIGRAQELLLILDEYWEANIDRLKDVPIYYASSLANDSIDIFKTYINMAGNYVRKKFQERNKNPFDFRHIKRVKTEQEMGDINNNKPCVVFASPGMLQSGLSKSLFEKWCSDKNNGIVITGYCVDKTLARKVLGEPKKIDVGNKKELDLLMSVKTVTFSAHSDFSHTKEFIERLEPKNIVLVHGEAKEMERLRSQFEILKVENKEYKKFLPKVYNPQNCQKIIIPFVIPKKGFIVGKLCQDIFNVMFKQKQYGVEIINSHNFNINNNHIINDNSHLLKDKMEIEEENKINLENKENEEEVEENFFEVAGVLIDEENILLNSDEIEKFSINNINTYKIKQILKVKYTLCSDILIKILKDYFKLELISPDTYNICSQIKLYLHKDSDIVLEWESSGYSDFLANSIAMIITQLQIAPNENIFYHYSNDDSICSYKRERLIDFLNSKYPKIDINPEFLKIYDWNEETGIVDFKGLKINCQAEKLRQKLHSDIELFKEL